MARNVMLILKDWFNNINSTHEYAQILNEIHAVLYHESCYKLGIEKELISSPAFCRLAFQRIGTISLESTDTEPIPWILLFKIILRRIDSSVLINLVDCFVISREAHTNIQLKISDCIQYALENGYITEIFWKECLQKPIKVENEKPIFAPEILFQWNEFIQLIVSLPEKMSNHLKLKTSSIFHPESYFAMIAKNIIEVLKRIHSSYQSAPQECYLSFISQIFAKICAVGRACIVYNDLIPHITDWVKETPLWCRICSKLFLSVPDSSLDSCIEQMIKMSQSGELLKSLFADTIAFRTKLKFLLTHKYLFVKTYDEDGIPLSILSYLSGIASIEKNFKEIVLKLLEVWGDKSSIKHSSFKQHVYISKCLLISLSLLNENQKKAWRSELTLKIMEAVPIHLESPDEKLNRIGMIVAECFSMCIGGNTGGHVLNFELKRNEEEEYLYKLSVNPYQVIKEKKEKKKREKTSLQNTKIYNKTEIKTVNKIKKPDVLDSDDELEPYNLDEDEEPSVNGVRSPIYLRDCMAGLISSKDPNRMEACLKVVKSLVLKEPGDLSDVAVELVKILLHMTNEYTIQNYDQLKRDAMIEVAVKCPAEIAPYLSEQFYTENYSLVQRMDMLEIISNTAIRLSSPVEEKSAEHYKSHLPLPSIPKTNRGWKNYIKKPDWRAIVDDRIEGKTRRFVKGPTKECQLAQKNRFANVAGLFFFPLLKNFGMRLNTCNMLEKDSVILGKFIYTLGVVIQCSNGLPVAVVMGKALFDLIWTLRYHKEAYVRQALIYSCTMIILHLPSFSLATDLQSEMFEAKNWLQELIESDTNVECKKIAASCLILMQKTMENELKGNS